MPLNLESCVERVPLTGRFCFMTKAWLAMVCAISLWLLPSVAAAQGNLPVQWLQSSIYSASSVAFSPDGSLLAVGGPSGLQIWTLSTSKEECLPTNIVGGSTGIQAVCFSPDGSTLAVSGNGPSNGAPVGTVELWSVTTRSLMASYSLSNEYFGAAAFSPDGTKLAMTGNTFDAGHILLLNGSNCEPISDFLTTAKWLDSVAFSPDGNSLAVGGSNNPGGVVQTWNVSSGTLSQTFATGANKFVSSVAYSADGATLADCGNTGSGAAIGSVVETWNVASGDQLLELSPANQVILSVVFSPDGTTLAVGGSGIKPGSDGVLETLSVSNGALQGTFATGAAQVNSVAYSPDGTKLADGGVVETAGVLEVWGEISTYPILSPEIGLEQPITAVTFSSDASKIAVAYGNGLVNLLDATTGKNLGYLEFLESNVNSIVFSSDGSICAGCGIGIESNGDVAICDASTGGFIHAFESIPYSTYQCVAISPDGTSLVACGYVYDPVSQTNCGFLEIWDIRTYELVSYLTSNSNEFFNSVVFSPDGTTVAVGGGFLGNQSQNAGGLIRTWSLSSGTWTNYGPSTTGVVGSVAFSPDGSKIAIGGTSGESGTTLEVWDVSSGKLLATPTPAPNTAYLSPVAFSPDGTTLYAGASKSAGFVNVPDGVQIFNMANYSLLSYYSVGNLTTLAVSPLGSQLAYSTSDGAIAVAPNPYSQGNSIVNLVLNPSSVSGGTASSGTVTLSQPAPSGGLIVLLASNASCATVPASVTVASGAIQATFIIATTPVTGNTNATISAFAGGSTATASLAVTPATISSLTLNSTIVQSGSSSIASVTLAQPSPVGGTVVKITSSDLAAKAPATVTVASGASTATFSVKTQGVDNQKVVTITASLGDSDQSATLTILPASLVGISLNPVTVIGGNSSTGLVALSGLAGPSGVSVSLSSSNADATVSSSVTIPSGQATGSFVITTTPVSVATSATITASLETVSKLETLSIATANPSLVSVVLSPTSIPGGSNTTGTVTLANPAGTLGVQVSLQAQYPAYVGVPSTCTVPSGSTSTTFQVATYARPLPYTCLITATVGTSSQSATLTVTGGYALSSLTLNPSTVTAGGASTGTVVLGGAAPSGGWVVNLSTGNPSLVTLPKSVTVPAGAVSATFKISVQAVTTSFTSTITATDAYATKTATLTVNGEGLTGFSVNPKSVDGGKNVTGNVTLKAAAPTGGWVVQILAGVPSAVSVPPSITIPAGETSVSFQIATHSESKTVTSGIYATDANTGANTSLTVLGDAVSHLSLNPTTIGSGGISTGTVTLNSPAPAGGWVLKLSASTATLVNMPSSLMVAAGASTATFSITGLATSTTTSCEVTASDALSSATATLTIAGDRISSLKLSPTAIGTNDSSTGTVTLKSAAPSGGWLVKISSSDPSLVIVQTAVIVPAGAESAKFEITAKPTASTTTVTIDVSDGNSSASATLKVDGDSILSLSLSPSSVVGGANSTGTVKLKSAAPPGGWPVKLTSANASVVSVPQSVLVPAGSSSVSFKVTTAKVTKTTGIEISASDGVSKGTATLTVKS